MKKLLFSSSFLAFVLSAMLLAPGTSRAQFNNGSLFLGPELGLGFGYGGGVVLGGMIEGAITNAGTVGSGHLAIAGRLDYYSWSDGDYSYSYIPMAVYCDYHFKLNDPNWDLFAGVGLGYVVVDESYAGYGNADYGYGSTIFLTAQVGARYFVSSNVAIRAEYGLGYMPLGVGVDFRL